MIIDALIAGIAMIIAHSFVYAIVWRFACSLCGDLTDQQIDDAMTQTCVHMAQKGF